MHAKASNQTPHNLEGNRFTPGKRMRQRAAIDQLQLTAQARLLLGPAIPHHQSSWVKLTLPVAAEALRITGPDLQQLGIIDQVLQEPSGGNHWAPLQAAETLFWWELLLIPPIPKMCC